MTANDNDKAINEHVAAAARLASDVTNDARRQLAKYKERVDGIAAQIEEAAKKVAKPTEAEKALLKASAKASASLADVMLDFADAAFETMNTSSQDTRQRATALVRKVVKLAVDETLDETNRAVSRTTRMIELRTDFAWETIYLPRSNKQKPMITLQLKGDFGTRLQVRAGQDTPVMLKRNQPQKIALIGSRPSLSFRLDPKAELKEAQSGLILVEMEGAYKEGTKEPYTLTLGLLAQAHEKQK